MVSSGKHIIFLVIFISTFAIPGCKRSPMAYDSQVITAALDSPDPEIREKAAYKLESLYFDIEQAEPKLIQLAETDPYDSVRIAALEALGALTLKQEAGLLEVGLAAMLDDNPDIRAAALEMLRSLLSNREQVYENVAVWCLDDNPRVRELALSFIQLERAPEKEIGWLREAIHDVDADIRFLAAWKFVGNGKADDEVVDVLIRLLDNPLLRNEAMRYLSEIGTAASRAVPYLEQIIEDDPDAGVLNIVIDHPRSGDALVRQLKKDAPDSTFLAQLLDGNPDRVTIEPYSDGTEYLLQRWENGKEQQVSMPKLRDTSGFKAFTALCQIKPDSSTFEQLVQLFGHSDENVRATLVSTFDAWPSGSGNEMVVREAVKIFEEDSSSRVRSYAAQVLGRIGGDYPSLIIPPLINVIEDIKGKVPIGTFWGLAAFGPVAAEARVPLENYLMNSPANPEGEHDPNQAVAAEAFISIGPESGDILAYLVEMSKHPNNYVRKAAVKAMAKFGNEAFPYLKSAFETDASSDVQDAAVRDIVHLTAVNSEASSIVAGILEGDNDGLRSAVILGIANSEEKLPIPVGPIISFLENAYSDISVRGIRSLSKRDYDGRTLVKHCFSLLSITEPKAVDAVPVLTKLLTIRDGYLYNSLTLTLEKIGPTNTKMAIPAFIAALDDPDTEIRWKAASMLGFYGPDAAGAVPGLTALLTDANPGVRWEAANSLGLIGDAASDAIDELETVAKDDVNPIVKQAAADAVISIKDL